MKKMKTSSFVGNHSGSVEFVLMCLASFIAFSCTFSIRTTLYVGEFKDEYLGILQLKVAFALFQYGSFKTMGFFLGKFPSIMFIPDVPLAKRFVLSVSLYGAAVLFFCGIQLFSSPMMQCISVFISGLFISPLWGLIVMYLEGRTTTEPLLAFLSLSPILASGTARYLGLWLLKIGFSDHSMPSVASLLSFGVFAVCMWCLHQMPSPSPVDIARRSKRKPITSAQRNQLLSQYAHGIIPITIVYSFMTAIRAYRDYFVLEMISESRFPNYEPSSLLWTEVPIAFLSLVIYGFMYKIQDNWTAFACMIFVMILGSTIVFASTFLYQIDSISTLVWLSMVGVGLYLANIPPGAMLYDRFISIIRREYTSVFLIYMSDASGYVFTISLLLYIHLKAEHEKIAHLKRFQFAEFYQYFCAVVGMSCVVLLIYAYIFFKKVSSKFESSNHAPAHNSYPIKELDV